MVPYRPFQTDEGPLGISLGALQIHSIKIISFLRILKEMALRRPEVRKMFVPVRSGHISIV